MKFLCVSCDEPMTLDGTEGPEAGSLTVIFGCSCCGNKVAMLTNPLETQLVRALDVQVGDPPTPRAPMQFLRSTLAKKREGPLDALDDSAPAAGAESALRCPFSAITNLPAEKSPLTWDPAAEQRLEHVPDFIRSMARQGIEQFAVERGYRHISEEVMDEARSVLGH